MRGYGEPKINSEAAARKGRGLELKVNRIESTLFPPFPKILAGFESGRYRHPKNFLPASPLTQFYFLRLCAIPARPMSPEPNRSKDIGSGTGVVPKFAHSSNELSEG